MSTSNDGLVNSAFETVTETASDLELDSMRPAGPEEVRMEGTENNADDMPITVDEIRAERSKERNDTKNIVFLLFLYFLQGIPLGISAAASFILADKKSSYSDLALFSIIGWPYSLKLLWAPLVDSIYWRKLGRRRSWLAPLQYLIGSTLLALSFSIDGWISAPAIGHDHVVLLTCAFLFVYLLVATQDIVVDGWAVSLLSRRRISWASTANVVGQTAGSCLSNLSLLSFTSVSFCNRWLRDSTQQSSEPVLTFGDFLFGWSFVFFVATTLVLLKRERSDDSLTNQNELHLGVRETYWTALQIIKLPSVIRYVLLIFVVRVAFAAVDSVTYIKVIETGFPKEQLAFFSVLLLPIELLFPLLIARWRNYTNHPLRTWVQLVLARLIAGSCYAVLLYFTPYFRISSQNNATFNQSKSENVSHLTSSGSNLGVSFTVTLLSIDVVYTCATVTMFLACMAFHARVSHPRIGGTYMTLLNTLSNLSASLPGSLSLWLLDYITVSSCIMPPSGNITSQLLINVSNTDDDTFETVQVDSNFACHSARGKQLCQAARGVCDVRIDGFYVEVLTSLAYGLLIVWSCVRLAKRLDAAPLSSWIPANLRAAESRLNLHEEEPDKDA